MPTESHDEQARIDRIKTHYRRAQWRLLAALAVMLFLSTLVRWTVLQGPGFPVEAEGLWWPCWAF